MQYIYPIVKADYLQRTRSYSFLLILLYRLKMPITLRSALQATEAFIILPGWAMYPVL
jgi:hypothetical protein